MTDAEIIQDFLAREQRWLQVLEALRSFHEKRMGKTITAVQWMGGRELGRLSWLGYYWHREMFWFGYGLHEGIWRPLIEADNRSRFSGVLENMRTELRDVWVSVAAEGNLYRRLWSSAEVAGRTDQELDWFRARSCELHEFVVQPGLG